VEIWRALVLLGHHFLFSTAEWHVNWYHFQAENPNFPRSESWSLVLEILVVGIVMELESTM